MADYKLLRLSATLVLIGEVILTILTLFLHPGGGATHEATFANYSASGDWAAVHLGQFISTAVMLAGLLVLFFALGETSGIPRWIGLFGAISAGVAIALAGVLYAVDGVALKQAVDAWASAPASEKAIRFATTEAIRWLEWGTNSYWNFMQGLALVLLAAVIVWTGRVARPIGYLMGLSGLGFIVLGWLVGTNGFTPANNQPSNVGYGFLFISMIWLLIVAWRGKESGQAALE